MYVQLVNVQDVLLGGMDWQQSNPIDGTLNLDAFDHRAGREDEEVSRVGIGRLELISLGEKLTAPIYGRSTATMD